MITIGIDTGITGAVAVLDCATGCLVDAYDVPTLGDGTSREVDARTLLRRLHDHPSSHIGLEKTIAHIGRQRGGAEVREGATGMQRYHEAGGALKAVVALTGYPFTLVAPATWKRRMMADMPKEKAASIQRALQLIPNAEEYLTLKKHHGRAEAALLAVYVKTYVVGSAS